MARKKQSESNDDISQQKSEEKTSTQDLEMSRKLFPSREELLSLVPATDKTNSYDDNNSYNENTDFTDDINEELEENNKKPKKTENKERKFSLVEQEALKQGWKPFEEYSGNPETWKDAESFVQDGHFWELKRQINDLRSIITNQQEALQLLTNDVTNRSQEKIDSLQKSRDEAILAADLDKVKELDKIINSISSQKEYSSKNQQKNDSYDAPSSVSPEINEFAERNKWWFNPTIKEGDPSLNGKPHKYDGKFYMQIADAFYTTIKNKNPFFNERQILFEVEKAIKNDYFPEMLQQNRAPPVQRGGIMRENNKKDISYDDLPDSVYDPTLGKTFNPRQVITAFMDKTDQLLSNSRHKPKISGDKNWYANFLKENYFDKK